MLNRKQRVTLVVLFYFGLQSVTVWAAVSRSGLFDREALIQDVQLEVATAHIPWAKPLYQGPLKALFIGPMYGHRETAEVAQRLALEYEVVFAGTTTKWQQYGAVTGHCKVVDVLDDLRRKLERPLDCIIIGNLDWALLPDDVVYKIFEHVAGGAGLVYVMYSQTFPDNLLQLLDAEPVQDNFENVVPLETLLRLKDKNNTLALAGEPLSKKYRFGRGKVVLIHYPGCEVTGVHYLTPDPYHSMAYEYCQSYLIKNILYACSRPLSVRITGIQPPQNTPVDQLETKTIDIQYEFSADPQTAGQLTASWFIRNDNGDLLASGKQPLPAGPTSSLSLPMPGVPAGTNMADVIITRDGEVLDWASCAFTVLSPYMISGIDFLNDTVSRDAKIGGQILLTELPEDARIVVEVRDNHGRIFGRADLPDQRFVDDLYMFSKKTLLWFAFPVKDSLTTINTARAELWLDNKLISAYEKEFYVPQAPEDDFLLGVWGNAERLSRWSHIQHLVCEREKQLGVDLELVGHYYSRPQSHLLTVAGAARCNLFAYPYVDRIDYWETDRVRNPCLTDPTFLNFRYGELQTWATELRKYGCFGYNLGDENNLSARGVDVCTSPSCLAYYREWLKTHYPDLPSINEQWNTEYTAWEEIFPPTRSEAQKAGNLAPWIDHRLYMTDVMMDYMAGGDAAIKSGDPQAKSGPEGIWGSSPYFGFDWQQLVDKLEIVFPYADEPVAFHAARSLATPTTVTGIWGGGYPPRCLIEPMAQYDPWMSILNGIDTLWFYSAYDGNTMMTNYNALSPDLRLNRSGQWWFAQTDRIRRGLGKLILKSRRNNDGIALLFSLVSSYLEGTEAANDLIPALHDAGYQFDLITPEGIKNGVLQNFRCLILPNCVALSEAEAAQIRDFVNQGGVVVADLVPATHNDHGKLLAASQLAEVFGFTDASAAASAPQAADLGKIPDIAEIDVTDKTSAQAEKSPAVLDATEFEQLPVGTAAFSDQVDVRAHANGKAIIGIHPFGQGKAVCLNFSLKGYDDQREFGQQTHLPKLLKDLLAELFVKPEIEVQYEEGQRCKPGVEVIRFAFDGGAVIALLRKEFSGIENPPVQAAIQLPTAAYIYEFETGRFLGHQDRIAVQLQTGVPLLFFALDHQAGPLALAAPPKVAAGETLEFTATMAETAFTVCHVEFLDPAGRSVQHYTRNYVMRDGLLPISRPLALNESKGQWTISVSDVLTSQKQSLPLVVE